NGLAAKHLPYFLTENRLHPLHPPSPRANDTRGKSERVYALGLQGRIRLDQTPRRKTGPVAPSSTPGLLGFAPVFRRSSLKFVLCSQLRNTDYFFSGYSEKGPSWWGDSQEPFTPPQVQCFVWVFSAFLRSP